MKEIKKDIIKIISYISWGYQKSFFFLIINNQSFFIEVRKTI